MDDALPFPIGAQVDGRYKLLAVLGQGGMGAVYRAEQVSLQREVALKVLRAGLGGDEAGARFSREALALSKLDHPNIVRVIDSGQAEGRPYLVMELVAGRDLLQELFLGPMSPPRAVPILAQLCDALAAAHARGIIHRDLKPENVILTEQGVPKILDFGIAVAADGSSRVTAAGFVLGTPEYLAPEQAMGQPLSPRSDLYTLGVVAYRMLSGQLPFTAKEPREYLLLHAGTPCPDLREKWPGGAEWPELCAVVMKALHKDPAQRYPDALAMKAALELALQHQITAGSLRTAPPEAPRAATSALAVKTQNLCVLFAEIAGWAERSTALPPHAASLLQSKFDALLAPVAKRFGGRKVKTGGGSMMFGFPGPTAGVQAAMAMQDRLWEDDRRLWEDDAGASHDRLTARIALSMGEVTLQEGDLFGEPVNIAARVLELAGPDEIVFTDAVYLAMNRSELLADELGPQQLKGIPYAVRAFKVRRGSVPELPPYGTRAPRVADAVEQVVGGWLQRLGGARQLALGLIALVLLAGAGFGLGLLRQHRGAAPVSDQDAQVLARAEKALAQGRAKETGSILAPLLARNPPSPRALATKGRAEIALGSWMTGLDALRDAAKADPSLRQELVNACMQGLAQAGGGKRKGCPVRQQAIVLLTAANATEARSELQKLADSNDCAHDDARRALSAIGTLAH